MVQPIDRHPQEETTMEFKNSHYGMGYEVPVTLYPVF